MNRRAIGLTLYIVWAALAVFLAVVFAAAHETVLALGWVVVAMLVVASLARMRTKRKGPWAQH
ncbi:MAG: hypothetical protein U0W40_10770 [Acidimicrobiia bacterium]